MRLCVTSETGQDDKAKIRLKDGFLQSLVFVVSDLSHLINNVSLSK